MYKECFGDGPFIYRLNENGVGPTLLQQVFIERGWREYNAENGDEWNFWWRTSGFPLSQYKELKHSQFTNHIPKGSSICRKDNLARHLKRMRKVYGSIYDFSPSCYNLPLEYTKLAAECTKSLRKNDINKDNKKNLKMKQFEKSSSRRWQFRDLEAIRRAEKGFEDTPIWICKPVAQSQGRGIFLFRKLSELTYENNSVVQKYIERPLLIGGYKFDLRLYVSVPSYHPLTIYLYRDGIVRFGTDKFSLADLDNPFRHLTNSSINKMGPGYAELKERIGAGCKWSLHQLRRYFNHVGISDWLLWQRVSCLIVLTILSNASIVPSTSNCFEFFGFDVLIDSELRPWLLEVNLSPALGNDCPVDEAVKLPMLHDLFDLMGLPLYNTGLSMYTMQNKSNNTSFDNQDEINNNMNKTTPINKKVVLNAAGRWRKHNRSARSHREKQKPLYKPPRLWETVTNSGQLINTDIICNQTGIWGNGRNWKEAPISEGGWSRIFPSFKEEKTFSIGGSVKDMVMQIQKFKKTAFEITKNYPTEPEEDWNARMRTLLELSSKVWVPFN